MHPWSNAVVRHPSPHPPSTQRQRTRLRRGRGRPVIVRIGSNAVKERAFEWEVSVPDRLVRMRLDDMLADCGYRADTFISRCHQSALNVAADGTASLSAVTTAFLLSICADLNAWGADIQIRESRLVVSLTSAQNAVMSGARNDQMRAALQRLRSTPVRYDAPLAASEALEFLESCRVELIVADESNPEATQAFRDGITTWSMPYRQREGRSRRFVLYGVDRIGRVPLGLLEIGDDAPLSRSRDTRLGFDPEVALRHATRSELAARFRELRASILPDGLDASPSEPIESLAPKIAKLRAAGRGRQGSFEEISFRKRLTYLARLASGEAGVLGIPGGLGLSEGLRALRDLTLTRVNAEMTICGALPPFGGLLVGKLVASMAVHPEVRAFVDRPIGSITASVFDTSRLAPQLPNWGTLFVTTKGLYPKHSAQYNGVSLPGEPSDLRLAKIGETAGTTTSHLSDLTMRLGARVLDMAGVSRVSRVYGSGGGKRQRSIEEAGRVAGIPDALLHAQAARPVYGAALVSNLERVCLLNEAPQWLVPAYGQSSAVRYEEAAARAWQERWLPVARRRHTSIGG